MDISEDPVNALEDGVDDAGQRIEDRSEHRTETNINASQYAKTDPVEAHPLVISVRLHEELPEARQDAKKELPGISQPIKRDPQEQADVLLQRRHEMLVEQLEQLN